MQSQGKYRAVVRFHGGVVRRRVPTDPTHYQGPRFRDRPCVFQLGLHSTTQLFEKNVSSRHRKGGGMRNRVIRLCRVGVRGLGQGVCECGYAVLTVDP